MTVAAYVAIVAVCALVVLIILLAATWTPPGD